MFARQKLWVIFTSIFILTSCGYVVTSIIPAHIKKIYIPVLKNETNEFGIENKLTYEVSKKFVEVPQLTQVEEEKLADAVVLGKITYFNKEPLIYDDYHRVKKYRIRIRVDIEFKDLVNAKTLWKEDGVENEVFYYPMGEEGALKTEQEMIKELTEKLANDIVEWLTKGW